VTATTKGFDALLVAHVILAVAALVVLAVLRAAATPLTRGQAPPASAMRSFTGRPELAGRLVHLVPATGLALVGLSGGAYGLTTGFVLVGIGAWAGAAVSLEAVAFPAQRSLAASLRTTTPDPTVRVRAATMARALEVAALFVLAAAAAMIAGPLG
jgi:hypothetical protein